MGAGMGPLGAAGGNYSVNRVLFHLHGGDNPWISDGTPHQWVTPPGETTSYLKGVSFKNVPDMIGAGLTPGGVPKAIPTPADNDGLGTYYYPNGQSSRLMFYHEHSYGITRQGVYAGAAAPYLLWDQVEEDLISGTNASGANPALAKVIPDPFGVANPNYHFGIPLVLQDKTFVPNTAQLTAEDPTWNWGPSGNLWFPHVYMTNQNPADAFGMNAVGRWDYGPWFWPPMDPATLVGQPYACPTPASPTQVCPGTPNPSIVPEAFMDTPIVNGEAYPILQVAPQAYRFRILNASNDRTLNLQLYYAATSTGAVCNPTVAGGYTDTAVPGSGTQSACTEVNMVDAVPHTATSVPPLCTITTQVTNPAVGSGLAIPALDATGNPLNGTGLPGTAAAPCWPTTWPTDGRDGGVPDPATAGPPIIQIGSEGGFLPAPVVIPSTPVNYEYNRRSITVLNISTHGLTLGPAERADVIIDFSQVPSGSRIIMYNDAPAPVPAFDTRYDYYTGDPDQTSTGGAAMTQPGYGPNIRTMMQFAVDLPPSPTGSNVNLPALQTAFKSTPTSQGAYAATHPLPIIPQAAYGSAFNATYADTFSLIQSTSLTFTPIDPVTYQQTGTPITVPIIRKAIHELFDLDYGRMDALLGVELPLTNFTTQTTIPYFYVDPPTEVVKNAETQLWKITHNGVDTHAIHVHLFNVQLVNRVGWDGTVRPPDPNEVGWKETARMNPLEDAIVALQPVKPKVPFPRPDSVRPLDVTMPLGTTGNMFTNVDPNGNPVTTVNAMTNFGWEYVWHCHLLGHEENDMMRAIVFQVAPEAPSNLIATVSGQSVILTWTNNSVSATGFTIQRALDAGFTTGLTVFTIGPTTPPALPATTFTDIAVTPGVTYYYEVAATSPNGTSAWSTPAIPSYDRDTIGLYAPVSGTFYLKNQNTAGTADLTFRYGNRNSTWIPIVGDWNGNKTTTVGLYNPQTGTFYLRNSNTSGAADLTFRYGNRNSAWIPIAGDWDGNGTTTVGLYDPVGGTFYLRNSNTTGAADLTFRYGPRSSTWVPIVGHWAGTAMSTIGLYDPATGTFYLKNTNTTGIADLTFTFTGSQPGMKPIAGDWDSTGTTKVGLYDPATSTYTLKFSNITGSTDRTFVFGTAGLLPIDGNWDGLP